MEPSSAEDGDLADKSIRVAHGNSSMEPSSAEDGDGLDPAAVRFSQESSMEPSSAEDGDVTTSRKMRLFGFCLQWSRPQLRTETAAQSLTPGADTWSSMEPSSAEDGDRPSSKPLPALNLRRGLREVTGKGPGNARDKHGRFYNLLSKKDLGTASTDGGFGVTGVLAGTEVSKK